MDNFKTIYHPLVFERITMQILIYIRLKVGKKNRGHNADAGKQRYSNRIGVKRSAGWRSQFVGII